MKGMAVRAMSFGDDRRSLVPKFPASAKAGYKSKRGADRHGGNTFENSAAAVAPGEIAVEITAQDAGSSPGNPGILPGPYRGGGDDVFGQLNIDRLKNDGVDVSAIGVLPGETTGSAFVSCRLDGDRDFVSCFSGIWKSKMPPE